ncbi:MAG TPA: hypothetical protein VM262_21100, partial [Acidimicrobiales bacterium]|nr:hypothetical protein [Acidimicrobiales bacterium]
MSEPGSRRSVDDVAAGLDDPYVRGAVRIGIHLRRYQPFYVFGILWILMAALFPSVNPLNSGGGSGGGGYQNVTASDFDGGGFSGADGTGDGTGSSSGAPGNGSTVSGGPTTGAPTRGTGSVAAGPGGSTTAAGGPATPTSGSGGGDAVGGV